MNDVVDFWAVDNLKNYSYTIYDIYKNNDNCYNNIKNN